VLKGQQEQEPDRRQFDPNNLEAISTTSAERGGVRGIRDSRECWPNL